MRRVLPVLTTLALLIGMGAAAYWAGANAVLPPSLPDATHGVQTYVAATGTVGRTETVGVTAAWRTTGTAYAAADGVVTEVRHEPGAVATAGEVLATVELRPVVAAAGRVPMFRALSAGVRGPDVRQFQDLLRANGFLKPVAGGLYDAATAAAAERWQRSIGVKADGTVRLGDLVFLGQLPARLAVVPTVGSRISVGGELAHLLGATPSFTAVMSAGTRAELTTGMTISIAVPDGGGTWAGALGAFEPTEDGRFQAPLTGPLCGTACDSLSLTGETALTGSVVLVPQQRGVVVPLSALVQTAAGTPSVVLADGATHDVRIVAQADGFAVVEGLPAGTAIVLPAEPAP